MKKKKSTFSFFAAPPDRERRREIEEYLVSHHPCLLRTPLGKSVLGEEISLFRVGSGARATVYVGTHHGMEWITALLLYRFLDDFCKSTERRGEYSSFMKEHSLYVIPLLNPDGVEIMLHGAAAGGAGFLRSFFADYAGFDGASKKGEGRRTRRFKTQTPIETISTIKTASVGGEFAGFNGRRLRSRRRRGRNGR